MHIDLDSTTMAKVEKAYPPYDEYAQCHRCGWFGSVGEFAGQVRARHPQHHRAPGTVAMRGKGKRAAANGGPLDT